ncbi:MAG TPA: GNAT family N-acetyltransferase [Gaiellaceae bacterium]|nr:GNAT family N-acetyltransferase [Gaiellaceae bacterium]
MERVRLEPRPVRLEAREDAAVAARRAAEHAGVVVRSLDTVPELEACSRLIEHIWDDGEPKAPTTLLRALSHAGSFVAGAYSGGELVGVSFGFYGLDDSEVHLHSHITGVDPEFQSRSIGFALKQFQRSWALNQGVGTIQWTADPLVRGNAYFNLVKLGATIVGYHDDFYGALRDRLNAGGESDRVVVRWELLDERSLRAAGRCTVKPVLGEGSVILRADGDGRPTLCPDGHGETLHAWLPRDIVKLREEQPDCARAWRRAVRETVGRSLARGYRAETITRDGWLVLTR